MTYKMLTVLVVDDDISIRSMVESLMLSMGVGHVFTAATWKEAEAICGTAKVSGAILDLVLQRGSGIDIGRDCAARNIPVVFATSMADEFNDAQMLELGWIIRKPVRLAALHRALDYFKLHAAAQRRLPITTTED